MEIKNDRQKKISFVIPALNEAESLPELIGGIRSNIPEGMTYEVIVDNDGSTDGTEQVVRGILVFARELGFSVMGLDFSPIKGPEGNIEYICHLKNGAFDAPEPDVEAVVAASHESL